MANERGYGDPERGGIVLRDYTQNASGLKRFRGIRKLNIDHVARGLTWFSLGLGLAEVLMPRRLQRLVGVKKGDYSTLIRLAGAREILSALLIFMEARPFNGVWSRIAGDAMDIGLLGAAFTRPRVEKERLAVATASVLGVAAVDAVTTLQLGKKRAAAKSISALTQEELNGHLPEGGFRVMRSITIQRSPEEVYRFWRNFENLPRFMYHLQEVRVLDDRRSHWVTSAPAGQTVEWDAEITEDRPNERIAWRSVRDADVPNSGAVRFTPAPGGRGTLVQVEIEYRPPAGALGRLAAALFGESPAQQIVADLARFKQVIETGEVIRSAGVPDGAGSKRQRVARPLPEQPEPQVTYQQLQRETERG